MNKLMRSLWVGLCILMLTAGAAAGGSNPEILAEAHSLLATKEVPNIERAIELLEAFLAQTEENSELLWSLAKAYLYLGDRSEDNKLNLFETGKAYADRAVAADANNPHAYYWQGALIGRIGQTKGILNSLFMIKPLQQAMERVLEIDDQYADAYFVLSSLYDQAPGWPISVGNRNKALEMIEIALELDPDNPSYLVQLAKVLVSHRRRDEALQVLSAAFAHPEMEIDQILRSDAEKLLAELQ